MYDLKTCKNKRYDLDGRAVIWFFDDEEHNAAKLLPDNLFVIDRDGNELWNMRKAACRGDVCVLLRVEGKKLYFSTFNGFSARLDTNTLELSDMKTHK